MELNIHQLEDDTRNAYEVTYAIMRRAFQITKLNEVRPEGSAIPPIPSAINQVLTHEVRYRLESK